MTNFLKNNSDSRKSNTANARGEHLYQLLEVNKDATQEEIKRAYRKLALKYHPDRNPNNPDAEIKFKEVNNANSILCDTNKRNILDNYGDPGLKLAEDFGEENFVHYILGDSKWCIFFRVIFEFTFRKALRPDMYAKNSRNRLISRLKSRRSKTQPATRERDTNSNSRKNFFAKKKAIDV